MPALLEVSGYCETPPIPPHVDMYLVATFSLLDGHSTGPRTLLSPFFLGVRVAFIGKEGPGKP